MLTKFRITVTIAAPTSHEAKGILEQRLERAGLDVWALNPLDDPGLGSDCTHIAGVIDGCCSNCGDKVVHHSLQARNAWREGGE